MNEKLFSRAVKALDFLKPGSGQDFSEQRFIALAGDRDTVKLEREYLSSLRAQRIFTNPSICWVEIDTMEGVKILFSGPRLSTSKTILVRSARASEFLYFSDLFETHPCADDNAIIEVLGAGSRADTGYTGHTIDQIAPIFDDVYVIEGDKVKTDCVSHLLSEICISLNTNLRGNYKLDFFEKIMNSEWISCELEEAKLLSIFNLSSPLQFIVHYWILEGLFFEYSAKSLYQRSNPAISEEEFYATIENELDWRPKEITAFTKLLSEAMTPEDLRPICEILQGTSSSDPVPEDKMADFVGRSVYKFRNGLVHSRHKSARIHESEIKKFSSIIFDITHSVLKTRSGGGESTCTCGVFL